MISTHIKAIIFDLDGTIIDTEQMWALATQQMLQSRGMIYDDALKNRIHNAVHGLSPIQACTVLKNIIGFSESPEELAAEKTQCAYTLIQGNIRFIPGFTAFFKRIMEHGFKVAIATNCSTQFVELADKEINLSSFFASHIYTPAHVANRYKPLPDIYIHAAQQLAVTPDACLVIEDSAAGIAAGIAAGMVCIGINTADNKMNLAQANFIIEVYDQLTLEDNRIENILR